MARPIQANAEQTRQRILGAAGRLFSHQGLGETSMRQIAADAEVSMATVHHYFGGKAELYAACIAAMYDELAELRDELSAAVADAPDLHRALESAVRRGFDFGRRHRAAVQFMMRVVVDTGEVEPAHRERFVMPFLELGARVLAAQTGRPPELLRMALLSLSYLVVRYALTTVDELALFTGAGPAGAVRATEDYLVQAASDLLGLPPAP